MLNFQPERTTLLAQLAAHTKTSSDLKSELEAYGAADPIKMEIKREAICTAKEACVLWTGQSDSFTWHSPSSLGLTKH